jgi:single-strand DNA-binding protein
MSKSLNTCAFSGYLGSDPDLHTFDNGDVATTLRLAVSNTKKVNGEYVDDTLWLDVKVYGKRAESVATYLTKGSFVLVTGRLAQPRSWQSNEGETRFSMIIDHADVTFGPKSEGNGGGSHQSRAAAAPAPASTGGNMFDGGDEDIPFAHLDWRSRRGDRCPQI